MIPENNSIAEIIDRATIDGAKSADLAELSELDPEALDSFRARWSVLDSERRRSIIGRLVELAEDNVELNFNEIFKLCLVDPDADVRSLAIGGLWENEEPGLIAPLVDLLRRDASDRVRAAAASALGRFTLLGEHGKLRAGYVDKMKTALLEIFNDEAVNEEIRHRALESLSSLSIPEVKKAIAGAYARGNDRLKVGAIYAMGRNCDPEWVPILFKELKNSDAERRFEAATALGELGDSDAVSRLIELGDDPDSEVRTAILQSLGRIGGSEAKEYLQSCMSSRDESVRESARQALHELQANEDPLSMPL
jgi:HEAT repeat protein